MLVNLGILNNKTLQAFQIFSWKHLRLIRPYSTYDLRIQNFSYVVDSAFTNINIDFNIFIIQSKWSGQNICNYISGIITTFSFLSYASYRTSHKQYIWAMFLSHGNDSRWKFPDWFIWYCNFDWNKFFFNLILIGILYSRIKKIVRAVGTIRSFSAVLVQRIVRGKGRMS